jgi:hypothetical protein
MTDKPDNPLTSPGPTKSDEPTLPPENTPKKPRFVRMDFKPGATPEEIRAHIAKLRKDHGFKD